MGEECFIESETAYRNKYNVTAMVDSELCFLRREDVLSLKDQYPGAFQARVVHRAATFVCVSVCLCCQTSCLRLV